MVAGRTGNNDFVGPLVEIIATENHPWLLRSATDAAFELGAGIEVYEAWAERLTDAELFGMGTGALQNLIEGLEGRGSVGGRTSISRADRIAIRGAWRKFLSDHRNHIVNGGKFKRNEIEHPRKLLGPTFTLFLPDGTTWSSSHDEINSPRGER